MNIAHHNPSIPKLHSFAPHGHSLSDSMRGASPPSTAAGMGLSRLEPPRHVYTRPTSLRDTNAEAQDLLRSQELFLSVVLDWQRSDNSKTSDTPPPQAPPELVIPQASHPLVQRTVQHHSSEPAYSSSFESSEGSDHEGSQVLLSFTKGGRPSSKPPSEDPSPKNLPKIHSIPPNHQVPALSLNNLLPLPSKKIGVYTPRSRRVLIEKYMEKRTKRLPRKKVRYRVRKTLANARPRVKGRFVKTEQPLTAAAVEEMEKRSSPAGGAAHDADDVDYTRAFFDLEKHTRADVHDSLATIVSVERRRGREIPWEEWAAHLETSMLALLPPQWRSESPLPDVLNELIHLLAEAEDECTQDAYARALHGCALYVVLVLSLYVSQHHPSLWEPDSPALLQHYHSDVQALWTRRKTKKAQTLQALEGAVGGIAAVICLGWEDGKRHLRPLFV